MNHEKPEFDVAIIGGGPGGACTAAYLAKAGLTCAVFETELFPRPHVGESLVPSSTRAFRELDFLPVMEEHGFPRKYGAVWTVSATSLTGRHSWEGMEPDCQVDIRFGERPQEGVPQNYTYHVDRGKFDLLLLKHAQKLGATVYSGVSGKHVDLDANGFVKVKVGLGRKEVAVTARMVVDASGRRTFLGNQLRLKVTDPVFDQYAVHGWFEGYDRGAGEERDYIFVHFLPLENTWMWQIPISGSVTSIGIVTQKQTFAQYKRSGEHLFWKCAATRPDLLDRLRRAKQMQPFREEGDYTYYMKQN